MTPAHMLKKSRYPSFKVKTSMTWFKVVHIPSMIPNSSQLLFFISSSIIGAPGETRTPNLQNLNLLPLPIGLQGRIGRR